MGSRSRTRAPEPSDAPEPRPEDRLGGHHPVLPGLGSLGRDQRQPGTVVGFGQGQRHVESADVIPGLASVTGAEQRHRDADARSQLPDGFPACVKQVAHSARDQAEDDVVDATGVRARHAFDGGQVEPLGREPASRADRRAERGPGGASSGRVIILDRRGTGLSDRVREVHLSIGGSLSTQT